MMKRCSKCGVKKSEAEFGNTQGSSDGPYAKVAVHIYNCGTDDEADRASAHGYRGGKFFPVSMCGECVADSNTHRMANKNARASWLTKYVDSFRCLCAECVNEFDTRRAAAIQLSSKGIGLVVNHCHATCHEISQLARQRL